MQHQCSNCFSEFSDDAPSSSPAERVFCVFCGQQLLPSPMPGARAIPFSADHQREESFALGVIGGGSSGFPDTLRQFRAHGAPRGSDSLSPVHNDSEEGIQELVVAPWRLGRFWISLGVGVGVGVGAALAFGGRSAAQAPLAASGPARAARPSSSALPPVTPSGCVATATSAAVAAAVSETKTPVTPVLEKRFWLERARSAQHHYHLADAERFYRRALAHAPHDSEALSGLGEVELLRGERAAADAHFREALEANSDYVPARIALADSYWQSGQAEAARSEYRQIVEQYSADLLPPYVSQRLESEACVPQCGETALTRPASALTPRPTE